MDNGRLVAITSTLPLCFARGEAQSDINGNEVVTSTVRSRSSPYGEYRVTPSAGRTDKGFTGHAQNNEVALIYMRARYYVPGVGRFASADTIVPNPADLQSFNRYSYVKNNPIKYLDPAGHAECLDSECDIVRNHITGKLRLGPSSTLYQAAESLVRDLGGLNDLEAMATIADVAAVTLRSWDAILPALSHIFLGVETSGPGTLIKAALSSHANGCAGVGREPHDCGGATDYFKDSGFHDEFKDGHNQPYHVWGYIAETASPGQPLGWAAGVAFSVWGNTFHERIQDELNWDGGWGTSWQDYYLSYAGMEIGTLITDQSITPAELGNVLRDRLGPNGNGSYGCAPLAEQVLGPLKGSP